jgi:hypothetical protein
MSRETAKAEDVMWAAVVSAQMSFDEMYKWFCGKHVPGTVEVPGTFNIMYKLFFRRNLHCRTVSQ